MGFDDVTNVHYLPIQLTSKSSQFRTIAPLWLDLLDDVERICREEFEQFPLSLIRSSDGGPPAECRSKQQALQIAQSILLTTALCELEPSLKVPSTRQWLLKSSQPTCGKIFELVFNENGVPSDRYSKLSSELIALFQRDRKSNTHQDLAEFVLSFTFARTRSSTGVYFTPPDVARFLIERVNHSIKSETRFTSGLTCLARRDCCNIFDPAVGAGIFLVELVNFFHRARHDNPSTEDSWTESLVDNILPGMSGCDVLLPSLVAAHLNLAVVLQKTGFDFEYALKKVTRLNLVLANSLDDLEQGIARESSDLARKEEIFTYQLLRETPMHAIVGNPPFFSQSQNDGNWIRALVSGQPRKSQPQPDATANYLEVDGERLRERKIWLHDDYVKFFRYAHWLIERSGEGVVGFVSNRGFVNNITFRGMRNSWLKTFDRIELIDLNGDSRNRDPGSKSELNAKRVNDENIFPIETGVAIAVLHKSPNVNSCCAVSYVSLRGAAKAKIDRLKDGISESEYQRIEPTAPNYFFDPRDMKLCAEYETGWRISDALPRYWSSPVTARDHFVIDASKARLLKRIEEFLDEQISDGEIRNKYFLRTRSHRYQPGDTRGWKLAEARRKLAGRDVAGLIRRVQYRPFDHRSVFWCPEMIDWPRSGLADQFEIPNNLVLVARRQSPPNVGASFFLVTDSLVIDGVLRSDNRGNESLFPLFVHNPERDDSDTGEIKINFSQSLVLEARELWQLDSDTVDEQTFARNLFAYIYAQFYSSEYRTRFAAEIPIDFPRFFLCRERSLATKLSELGHRLIDAHLGKKNDPNGEKIRSPSLVDEPRRIEINAGYPKHDNTRVWLNKSYSIPDITPEVWNYRFGKHQVARKWLKDRRKHGLCIDELKAYLAAIDAIKQTISIQREIDQLIEHNGGWQSAFRRDASKND